MRALLGILIIVGTFLLAFRYMSMEFDGYLNVYAALLLTGVPLGVVVFSYRTTNLLGAVKGLVGSIGYRPEDERGRLARKVLAFGREMRRGQLARAAAILDQPGDPVFTSIARRVLEGDDADAVHAHARIQTRKALATRRDAEQILTTFGEAAPAMGMIGTVIGLIQLLANMRDFEKLGPGMAIALLTTFYGLILAHLLWLPLARIVSQQATRFAENVQMVTDGLARVAERRPLHEIQEIVGETGDAGAPDLAA